MSDGKPWIHIERSYKKRLGRNIVALETCESTNTIAMELARSGATDGTLVIAKNQTKGKGRLNRTWESWPGNLAMSLIVRPNLPITSTYRLVFASACAIVEALSKWNVEAYIKWPNDILIKVPANEPLVDKLGSWRKIGGILLEIMSTRDNVDAVIIGIGLNVARPEASNVTELIPQMGFIEDACAHTRLPDLVEQILDALEFHLDCAENDKTFSKTISTAKHQAAFLGEQIRVEMGDNILRGIAKDFALDGGLVVQNDSGQLETVYFGDVHLEQRFKDA